MGSSLSVAGTFVIEMMVLPALYNGGKGTFDSIVKKVCRWGRLLALANTVPKHLFNWRSVHPVHFSPPNENKRRCWLGSCLGLT